MLGKLRMWRKVVLFTDNALVLWMFNPKIHCGIQIHSRGMCQTRTVKTAQTKHNYRLSKHLGSKVPGSCLGAEDDYGRLLFSSVPPVKTWDSKNHITGQRKFRATTFCSVPPIICGSSVWKLLLVILLEHRILRRLLVFWKMCEPLPYNNVCYGHFLPHPVTFVLCTSYYILTFRNRDITNSHSITQN
jgi:hypothetical protein